MNCFYIELKEKNTNKQHIIDNTCSNYIKNQHSYFKICSDGIFKFVVK